MRISDDKPFHIRVDCNKILITSGLAVIFLTSNPLRADDIIGFQAETEDYLATVRMVPAKGGSSTPVYQDRFPEDVNSPPYLQYRGSWDPAWTPDGKGVVIKLDIMDSLGDDIQGRVLFLASAPIPRLPNKLVKITPDNWEVARQYTLSPDGEQVAFFGLHGDVEIEPGVSVSCLDWWRELPAFPEGCSFDLITQPINPIGEPNVIWSSGGDEFDHSRPAWSRDSNRIAFTRATNFWQSPSDLLVAPATGGTATLIAEGVEGTEPIISWSADGSTIAYATASTVDTEQHPGVVDIVLIDVDTGETTNLTNANWEHAINPVYSPDGSKIAFLSIDPAAAERSVSGARIVVYDLLEKNFQILTSDVFAYEWTALSWSSDSQSIAYAYGRERLGVAVAKLTGPPSYLTLPKYISIAPAFRPTIDMPPLATLEFDEVFYDLLTDTLSIDVRSTRLGNLFLLGPQVKRVKVKAGQASVSDLELPVSATVCSQKTGYCASHN